MPRLAIYLLGSFRARFVDSERSVSFRTEKERALLAFLVLESDRAHTRDALAEMFWPDRPEGIARTNLRQALAGIRRAIGDRDSEDPHLEVTDEAIRFNPASSIWLDIQAFTTLLQEANNHEHQAIFHCSSCIRRLQEAADLYRGDFVDGFSLPKSQQFLEWAAFYRELFFRQYMVALEHLSDHHLFRREFEEAYALASKQAHLAPLEEKAHRRLMRILAINRRRSAAIEQYHTCERILREELGVDPSPETVRLFEQIKAGGKLELEQPSRQPAPPTLPLPLTPFFGREKELDWLSRCLPNPVCRLLTLIGMPGVGKTRLAVQAARSYESLFPDGIFFATLENHHPPDGFLVALIQALGLPDYQDGTTRENILKVLAGRKALLVIDGFELFLSETGFLLELLRGSHELKILLTSRQKLNYQAACYMKIEGLPYPVQANEVGAADSPAVQLFTTRAERMRAGFIAGPENLPEILDICELVRGNPLALELAAARLREYDLTQIAEALNSSLDLLETTQKDVPSHHRSMAAAILLSWKRLAEADRALIARLAVFSGRFLPKTAIEVTGATLLQLTSLADQSLLEGDATAGYELHPLIWHFAAAKLKQDPTVEDRLREKEMAYNCPPGPGDRVLESPRKMSLVSPAEDPKGVTRDPLTRLPNRLVFEDRLEHGLTLVAREARPLAVLLVELQPDPSRKDDQGATSTHRLMPAIALLIRATIRESDTLARIGERTFGLLLHTLQEPWDAYRVAEKIYREIDRFYLVSGYAGASPVRIGGSLYPQDGEDRAGLLKAAANACNEVREEDEIPVRFFSALDRSR